MGSYCTTHFRMAPKQIDTVKTITPISNNEIQNKSRDKKEDIDDLWADIGSFGRWQKAILAMTFFISFFNSVPEMQYIFISAEPEHWCLIDEFQDTNWTMDQIKSISIPKEKRNGEDAFSRCRMFNHNYTTLLQLNYSEALKEMYSNPHTSTRHCTQWEYDASVYLSTTVTEWDLVCNKKPLSSVALSAFMIGVLVSSLGSGVLADKFGRRPVLIWSSLLWVLVAAVQCFPPNYPFYVLASFFVAIFVHASYAAGFVIITEIVGTAKHRSLAGILFQTPYLFGFMAVPGIAYKIREWRYLQWTFNFPVIIILFTIWFVPESPRWLLTIGKKEEATKILIKAAKANKKKITDTDVEKIVDDFMVTNGLHEQIDTPTTTLTDRCSSICVLFMKLFGTREMLKRTLVSNFCWFAMNVMFFGLSFDAIHLPVDPFLATFIIAAVDLPAVLLSIPLIDKYGRRIVTSVTFIIGGTACLLEIAPPIDMDWLITTFSSIGKLCATACYVIMYLYQAELYPTEIRNMGVGLASVMGRVGSIIAPYIVSFSLNYNNSIPKIVFGSLGITAGFATLLLPETFNKEIPETVKEIETCNKKYCVPETSNIDI